MLTSNFTQRKGLVVEDIKVSGKALGTQNPVMDPQPAQQGKQATKKSLHQVRSRRPSILWWLMAIPAFIISVYGAAFFTGLTPGDPQIKARIISSFGGVVHIGGSLVAMGLGPFQFLPHLRQQYPAVHRWTGWVYVLAVIVGGVAAFYVTLNSEALPWGKVGFALLALGWLETARQSIVAIWRDGDIKGHQAWMTRNFSLTYAAVMLRWQLLLMMAMGMEVKFALSITGYASWIPNLLYVDYFVLNRGDK
ncbi:hypothetical protein QIS74_06534 [Colletotrichum tabaci]|uniref:DUF2306 domain-containing protein n=1 Tax=Colletotrichum tabaci TaxID=1209068 RepID=A0AAV9TDF9_9PEZI